VIGLIKATAEAWGGNPDKEAKYLNVFPPNNDAKTVYRLMLRTSLSMASGQSAAPRGR
jgi:hypothetical protein